MIPALVLRGINSCVALLYAITFSSGELCLYKTYGDY